MTARSVQRAICSLSGRSLWNPARVCAMPNCTVAGWDSDLLIVHPSKWVWEIEIKVSIADLKRDFIDKARKHATMQRGSLIRRFYVAIPETMLGKASLLIPDYAGIITVDDAPIKNRRAARIVRHGKNLPAVRAGDETIASIHKSAYFRYWRHANRHEP